MTITYTTEIGRELTVPSEEALEAGWDYYNDARNTKKDMIAFCALHGVNIREEGTKHTLVDDWAEIVACTYANHAYAEEHDNAPTSPANERN